MAKLALPKQNTYLIPALKNLTINILKNNMSDTNDAANNQPEDRQPPTPYKVAIKRFIRKCVKGFGVWLAAARRTIVKFTKSYPRLAYNFVFFLLLGCAFWYYYQKFDKGSSNQKISAINLLNNLPDGQKLDTLARFVHGDAITLSSFPYLQTYTVTPKLGFKDRVKEVINNAATHEYRAVKTFAYIPLNAQSFLYKNIENGWQKMQYKVSRMQGIENEISFEREIDYNYNANALAIPFDDGTANPGYLYINGGGVAYFTLPAMPHHRDYLDKPQRNVFNEHVYFTVTGVDNKSDSETSNYLIDEILLIKNSANSFTPQYEGKVNYNSNGDTTASLLSSIPTQKGLVFIASLKDTAGKQSIRLYTTDSEVNLDSIKDEGYSMQIVNVNGHLHLFKCNVNSGQVDIYTQDAIKEASIPFAAQAKLPAAGSSATQTNDFSGSLFEMQVRAMGNTVWVLTKSYGTTEDWDFTKITYTNDGVFQSKKALNFGMLPSSIIYSSGESKTYIIANDDNNHRMVYQVDSSGFIKPGAADSLLLAKTSEASLYLNGVGEQPDIIADFYNQTYLVQFVKDAGGFTPHFIGGVNLADSDFDVHVELDLFLVFILFVFVTALYYLLYFFVSGYLVSRRAEINYDAPIFIYLPFLKGKLQALENKAKELRARSEGMLTLGVLLGVGGAVAGVITFKYSQLSDADTWTPKALFSVLRPFVLLTFIQVFTFFFLKQYRIIFNEYKRFYSSFLKAANYINAIEMNSELLVTNNVVDAKMKETIANKILDEITQLHENDTMAKIDEFDHDSILKVLDAADKFKKPL